MTCSHTRGPKPDAMGPSQASLMPQVPPKPASRLGDREPPDLPLGQQQARREMIPTGRERIAQGGPHAALII